MYTIAYTKPGTPGHLVTDSRATALADARADVESRPWWGAGYRVVAVTAADGIDRWADHAYWYGT